jgi:glycosyltransferase involved in cell wall biosynthesis
MKIAITADPIIPVPPLHYGGIERVIDMLIKGLMVRGHEVCLFAHKDSMVDCELISYRGIAPRSKWDTLRNMQQVSSIMGKGYDLVHSFGRLAYLTALLPTSLPKLMSYQREPSIRMVKQAMRLSRKGSMHFTGCSSYIADQVKPYAPAYAIPNGVPIRQYTFREHVSEDAPLVFLGRVEYIKGAHVAIAVAQKSGRKLLIAGNIPEDAKSKEYFDTLIKPQLNERIAYIGPVNDIQKNELLGQAYAFLMPILWNEPFGIVMAEALACGTPVIGMDRGSVPEVVEEGVNGYRCQTVEDMILAVGKVADLSRLASRRIAEEKFSDQAIVVQYEALYQNLISHAAV